MKSVYSLGTVIISMLVASSSIAANTPSIDAKQMHIDALAAAVLPPGARIVAGDPAKNEFFILARGETPRARVIADRDSPHMQSTADHTSSMQATPPSEPVDTQSASKEVSVVSEPSLQPVVQPATVEQTTSPVAVTKSVSAIKVTQPAAIKAVKAPVVAMHHQAKAKEKIATSIKLALAQHAKLQQNKPRHLNPDYVAHKKLQQRVLAIKQKPVNAIQVIRTTLHQTHYITGQDAKPQLVAIQQHLKHKVSPTAKIAMIASNQNSKAALLAKHGKQHQTKSIA